MNKAVYLRSWHAVFGYKHEKGKMDFEYQFLVWVVIMFNAESL
jgi:hypothetical protein